MCSPFQIRRLNWSQIPVYLTPEYVNKSCLCTILIRQQNRPQSLIYRPNTSINPVSDSHLSFQYFNKTCLILIPVYTPFQYVDRSQVQAFSGAHFGRGLSTSRIWLDNVRCTGYESRLTSCSANSLGVHNCDHSEDAGVSCGSASTGSKNGCETSVGIVNRTFKGTSLLETSVLYNW